MSSRPQPQPDPVGRVAEAALPFVEKLALVLTNAGMPRMPSRVFAATLASHNGSLTAGDLAEVLQISPAAVSGSVRYLVQVGLLLRGRTPGERRDHFYIGNNFWYEAVGEKDQLYKELSETLDEGREAVGADSPAGQRIAETRDFFNYLAEEMPRLVERWRERRLSGSRSAGP